MTTPLKRTSLFIMIYISLLFGNIQTMHAQICINDSLRYLLSYFQDNSWDSSVLQILKHTNKNVKHALNLKLNERDINSSRDWKYGNNGSKTRTVIENGNWNTETRFANGSYSSQQWCGNGHITTDFFLNGDYCISTNSDSLYSCLQRQNGRVLYYCYYTRNDGYSNYLTSIYIFEESARYDYNKTKKIGSETWSYHEFRDIHGVISRTANFADSKKGNCWKDSEQNGHLMYRADEYIRNSGEISVKAY